MSNGQGYLYAARENRCLTFSGTVKANAEDVTFEPVYSEDGGWESFSLYGNPFVCDAYLVTEEGSSLAFYVMNEAGTGFEVSEGPVSPMQGFFVVSTADQTFTVSRDAPTAKGSSLCMSLMQGADLLDNALLRFGKGNMLPKKSFREESSKVYVTVDGQDFAAVNAEAMGEMPLCFKAAKNGEYTLYFKTDAVNMDYLHLVDNLTGEDVDLLAEPSYSFKAKTNDYASRFKLLFVCGDANDGNETFAYYADGEIRLTAPCQGASLQIVDMTGRVVFVGDVSGNVSTKGMTQGVYVLRLVSGETVRTQKIVVQ